MLGSISRGLISRQAAFASVEGLLCFRFLLILCFGIDSCALVGSLDAFLAIVSQHWLIDHLVRVHWVGHWQFGCYITLQKVCSWDREVTADSKGSMVICTSFWHIHQTPPYSSAQVWQKFRHEIIQYFCVCVGKNLNTNFRVCLGKRYGRFAVESDSQSTIYLSKTEELPRVESAFL